MTACPICSAPVDRPFLVRDPVTVHQNLIVRDVAAARALLRGRLALHACPGCGFVFNAAFDASLLEYGAGYDNTQSYSPGFEQYVSDLAADLVHGGIRNSRILEIGCGKGGFLRALVGADPGNTGVGYDPSYEGPNVSAEGRLRFERRFYDETCAGERADAVVCRHVIEHLPDPIALLRTVRRALAGSPARVFFETPCVEWILEHEVIWDFFYEHCSYFNTSSLSTAFEASGFCVDGIRHVFGGQYLWAEAHLSASPGNGETDAGRIPALARSFAAHEHAHLERIRNHIVLLRRDGPVALWGAAAKGVTLAALVDPAAGLIDCVVDLNPRKQGGWLPGTGHPIVAPHDLPARGVRTAIVTNPNYLEENARLLAEGRIDLRLVDLMDSDNLHAHSD